MFIWLLLALFMDPQGSPEMLLSPTLRGNKHKVYKWLDRGHMAPKCLQGAIASDRTRTNNLILWSNDDKADMYGAYLLCQTSPTHISLFNPHQETNKKTYKGTNFYSLFTD